MIVILYDGDMKKHTIDLSAVKQVFPDGNKLRFVYEVQTPNETISLVDELQFDTAEDARQCLNAICEKSKQHAETMEWFPTLRVS